MPRMSLFCMDNAQVAAPPLVTTPNSVPLVAVLVVKKPPEALPNWLPFMFKASRITPLFTIPWTWPAFAVEANPRTTLLLMFRVPAAAVLLTAFTMPVVAVAAVMLLLRIWLPLMFTVATNDALLMPVMEFVVEIPPPSTQFCTVLLLMLWVALRTKVVSPSLRMPMIDPVVAAPGLFVIVTVCVLIAAVMAPVVGAATE